MFNNHLTSVLSAWATAPGGDWVLATVYRTRGATYRKAGSWALFNGLGQRYGLLSGGCLESDIQRQARRVILSGRAITVSYDTGDDGSFLPTTGCGGVVDILLQPLVDADNLDLLSIHESLQRRCGGWYYQRIPGSAGDVAARFQPAATVTGRAQLKDIDGAAWLVSPVRPAVHLLVVGGGADAQPLVAMAGLLGWRVSLCDPRPANARAEHFPQADLVLRELGAPLLDYLEQCPADAAVLMTHSLSLDAQALECLHNTGLRYMALLGPHQRRCEVMTAAQLRDEDLFTPLRGPAGLDLGAEYPESIALSILAEAEAVLNGRQGGLLSQVTYPTQHTHCA